MAEPKKETVRIALPSRSESPGSEPGVPKPDTTRISLPSRTPVISIRRLPPTMTPLSTTEMTVETSKTSTALPRRPPVMPPPDTSPLLRPLPKPPGIEKPAESDATTQSVTSGRDESSVAPSVNRGPKNETARISVLPRPTPAARPAVNMTKTQPLLVQPAGGIQPAPVVITSRPVTDTISRPLCWTLLAVSAVIFLIQIWNYVVS